MDGLKFLWGWELTLLSHDALLFRNCLTGIWIVLLHLHIFWPFESLRPLSTSLLHCSCCPQAIQSIAEWPDGFHFINLLAFSSCRCQNLEKMNFSQKARKGFCPTLPNVNTCFAENVSLQSSWASREQIRRLLKTIGPSWMMPFSALFIYLFFNVFLAVLWKY